MRFAIVFGLGVLANAIHPMDTGAGIGWWIALAVCLLFDLADYGQKSRKP